MKCWMFSHLTFNFFFATMTKEKNLKKYSTYSYHLIIDTAGRGDFPPKTASKELLKS